MPEDSPTAALVKRVALISALVLLLLLTLFTRLQSLDDPHLMEFDTVYFHNVAEKIVLSGDLPAVESDRYYPLLYDGGDLHVPTYSIVFLCRINPFCLSTFEGVKSASKWYAPIFTILTALVLVYLGLRAGGDWFMGALLFVAIPGALFRSVAGFSDKDTAAFFLMILSVYFVYRYVQEKRLLPILIYGSFAGIAMALSSLSLTSYVLYLAPVLLFQLFKAVFLFRSDKSVFGTVPLVAFPVLLRLVYGSFAGIAATVSMINIMTFGAAFFLVVSYFVFKSKNEWLTRRYPSTGFVNGMPFKIALVFAVTIAAGLLAAAALGISPPQMAGAAFLQVTDPLRVSVHGSSVGENQPTGWAWPWEPAFQAGANTYWEQMKLVFPLSLLIFAVAFLSRKDEDILTACLLGFNIYAASRGVRLFVNLMPIAAFAAGQVVAFFAGRQNSKYVRIAAAVVLAAAFIQVYPITSRAASTLHTSVNPEWFENFKWTDLNMRPASPVLAWWDYGYWIQYFARRPSVADGGNRILKMDQELGLMFTENDEDKAAAWMLTLPYPIVRLEISNAGGGEVATFSNEVFAKEYFANFEPDRHLIGGECVTNPGTLPKVCDSFLVNASVFPPGRYGLLLSVDYRGIIKSVSASIVLPSGAISGLERSGGDALMEAALLKENDTVKISPHLSAEGQGILFGYEPIDVTVPLPRLMTHDATMIGKMYWASRIGGRPTQYAEFAYAGSQDTPWGPARIYGGQDYMVAVVNSNGSLIPLVGASGQNGYAVLSDIVTPTGIVPVKFNETKTPGGVLVLGNEAYLLPPDAERSVFTNTFLLDGAPSTRFREVFSNGFAKSFYVI